MEGRWLVDGSCVDGEIEGLGGGGEDVAVLWVEGSVALEHRGFRA